MRWADKGVMNEKNHFQNSTKSIRYETTNFENYLRKMMKQRISNIERLSIERKEKGFAASFIGKLDISLDNEVIIALLNGVIDIEYMKYKERVLHRSAVKDVQELKFRFYNKSTDQKKGLRDRRY